MYLITGLGNPGKEYENTRHNVGFIALDLMADSLGIKINKVKFKGLLGEATYEGSKILLLKPHTYMNLSGESVKDAVNYYKIPPEKLIVIYDDMDLPIGRLRIRPEGSGGGHRGMDSIIYHLSSDKFPRVRIGIGRPEGEKDAAHHVLGKFYGEELEKIKITIETAAKAALLIVSDGVDQAMNRYNGFEA
ncbi:MAG: aminoacyl-tRNA hydrolase [Thermoanaerobacteraceae bacterium]|nr:aminoacyl-tRNA hydrolase [Thermoanaerobacteraceae bacterium]